MIFLLLFCFQAFLSQAQTLSPAWTYDLGSNFFIDAGDEHLVYFDIYSKHLRVLELESGAVLWEELLDVESFVVDGTLLFLFTEDLRLEARHLNDGQILWSKDTLLDGFGDDYVRLEPTPSALLIQRFQSRVVNYKDSSFLALNKATGEALWTWQPSKSESDVQFIASTEKNHIFKTDIWEENTKGGRDRTTLLYGVDQQTGSQTWLQAVFQASQVVIYRANIIVSNREAEQNSWAYIDANTGNLKTIRVPELMEYYGEPDDTDFLFDGENIWFFAYPDFIEDTILARFNLQSFTIEDWFKLPSTIFTVADFYSSLVKPEATIQFYYPPVLYRDGEFVANPTAPKVPFALHSLNLLTKEETYFPNALRKELIGDDWHNNLQASPIYHAWTDQQDNLLFWSDDFGHVMVFDTDSTELLVSQSVSGRYTDHKLTENSILLWGYEHSENKLFVFHR